MSSKRAQVKSPTEEPGDAGSADAGWQIEKKQRPPPLAAVVEAGEDGGGGGGDVARTSLSGAADGVDSPVPPSPPP